MFEREQQILASWNIGAVESVAVPATGTINQTQIISTRAGRWVLRRYRRRDRIGVEREHALIAYARAQGVPAVAPVPLTEGTTILEHEGRSYALFPHAPGVQVARADLRSDQIAAMGVCLARLHVALASYPQAKVDQRSLVVDRTATLRAIDEFVTQIRSQSTLDISDEYALRRLAGQQRWIEQHHDTPIELDGLPQQVIHGDYTEANLFFDADQISAIIDWEQAYVAPRAWEIVRTIDLVFHFEAAACQILLNAYRQSLSVAWSELDRAALCYAAIRAHDVWMYEAAYGQGNDRVRQFWGPDGFVPLDERWHALRRTLR